MNIRLALLLALMASPLAAQQATTSGTRPPELRDGRWGLSFGVGYDGAGVGFSHMMSARTAFTMDLRGHGSYTLAETEQADTIVEQREHVDFRVTVSPGFRRYGSGRGEVASFVGAHAILGFEGYSSEHDREVAYYYHRRLAPLGGLGFGVGLEWFVTDALSLRGQIGANATYTYREHESVDNAVTQTREHSIQGNLGPTGVTATFWF